MSASAPRKGSGQLDVVYWSGGLVYRSSKNPSVLGLHVRDSHLSALKQKVFACGRCSKAQSRSSFRATLQAPNTDTEHMGPGLLLDELKHLALRDLSVA